MNPYRPREVRAEREGGEPISKEAAGTAVEVTGLISKTMYSITVRGRSAAGLGLPSAPLSVQTDPGAAAPPTPFEVPALSSSSTESCDGLELALPELRPGCAGDQTFTLLAATDGDWYTIKEGISSRSVKLQGLDAYASHRFKLVAVNAAGESKPSRSSDALVTDAMHASLTRPPTVRATSSASFRVEWATSPCRSQLDWEV